MYNNVIRKKGNTGSHRKPGWIKRQWSRKDRMAKETARARVTYAKQRAVPPDAANHSV